VLLFKTIKKTLYKRKELIEQQFKAAEDSQAQADELKAQYQSELDGVEDERKQILVDAREDAKAQYNKIVERAQNDADKIKADARKAADYETEKARLAVKEEIAALAMETAQKVIAQKVSSDTDSSLYDKFLDESSDE
ncbi:MAG: ATP synthase F0 subunit B, partial [Eubacterium sp.]|nr:ATP synthase F0 subunit B [Eubacterium sp.]